MMVSNSQIKCSSIAQNSSVFIDRPSPCIPEKVRELLGREEKVEARSIILCRNNKIIKGRENLSNDNEINYCVATILDNVKSITSLGQGTFGKVYKWTYGTENNEIAMKKYAFLLESCRDFIREFLAMSRLGRHNNIVQYFGVFVDDHNDICIGMEYMQGGSLGDHLKASGALAEADIRRLSIDILRGLKALHDSNINHRDIKSFNVLLHHDLLGAKLCDFGLSKILDGFNPQELSSGISQTGGSGTTNWMAPEVLRGEAYALKADIWSVGATVVEMITGKIPFDGWEDDDVQRAIETDRRITFDKPVGISCRLERFVDYCLTANSKERPNVNLVLEHEFLR